MKKSMGARPLIFPTPVWLVGSYDAAGKPNLMTASWAGICCSSPPCVSVSLRKATYTYSALMERRAYTLSVPSVAQAKTADRIGLVSGAKVNKFEELGLTPVRSDLVDAPYPAELAMIVECKVIHTLEVGLHTMFVGQIADVKCDESILGQNGLPDMTKLQPFLFAPELRAYYATGAGIGEAFSIGNNLE